MEGESSVPRSIIDEFHFLDIQRDQMEGERGVTRRIIEPSFLGYPMRLNGR